jgi:hypothetical protein
MFVVSQISKASEAPKYKNGDCITPTDNSYSWYGKYARVEAFSKIEGYSGAGEQYILLFPNNYINSVIFTQEIELYTKSVNKTKCQPLH